MTRYNISGQPLWAVALKFAVPIVLLATCFYCGRACVLGRVGGYGITILPPDERGSIFMQGAKDLEFFRRSDPLWADIRLGASGLLVAHCGESLLGAAMALNMFGLGLTPATLAQGLPPESFDENGQLIWQQVVTHPDVAGRVTIAYEGPPSSERLDEALAQRMPTLLRVKRNREEAPYWVMLYGRTPQCYMIIDPRKGKREMMSQYRNSAYWQVSFKVHEE